MFTSPALSGALRTFLGLDLHNPWANKRVHLRSERKLLSETLATKVLRANSGFQYQSLRECSLKWRRTLDQLKPAVYSGV